MTGGGRQFLLFFRALWLSGAITFLAACDSGVNEAELPRLASTSFSPVQDVLVSTPNSLATDVGLGILSEGGSAMDAAVAVVLVLGFVEAPETGMGGGGFLMHYSAKDRQTQFYDGRETAPLAAEANRFTILGQPVPLYSAVPSGRAVGVPGLLDMLRRAHRDHGRLPWQALVKPAADLARQGVPMPDRLQQQIQEDASLRLFGDMRRYFREQADAKRPRLVNPELADTLERIAEQGPRALYRPPLSTSIIDRANSAWIGSGDLAQVDFDRYKSVERPPVCGQYRQYRLCGAAPPSSGGIAVLQILGMLSHFELAEHRPDDAEAWHLVMEATRLAFADRHRYIGDPDVVNVPVDGLLDAQYLARRASMIDPNQALSNVQWGQLRRLDRAGSVASPEAVRSGTSHISLVDKAGNAVSLTSSIEKPFGTRMMASGFILNNQLTDFTFEPKADFGPHPNAPGPGKRPRSSMSPILVFNADDELVLVLGSRGGSRIISYVVKVLIGVLDWELSVQEAINLPNVVYAGDSVELEADTRAVKLQSRLEQLGQEVSVEALTSGLHGVQRWRDGWRGGADPRLDGVARGYTDEDSP